MPAVSRPRTTARGWLRFAIGGNGRRIPRRQVQQPVMFSSGRTQVIERSESPVRRPTRRLIRWRGVMTVWSRVRLSVKSSHGPSRAEKGYGDASAIPGRHARNTRRSCGLRAYACVFSCGACARTRRGAHEGTVHFAELRICARFPRIGQRHPPCPSTGRGSDRPRQPAARTSSFD